jgi:hypothetical protein
VKILFDQGVPVPSRRALSAHEVATAFERGWGEMKNGELLRAAEIEGFQVMVTTDQNLQYQQNLSDRRLAILVLKTTDWRAIRSYVDYVLAAINQLKAGGYRELPFPPPVA